MVRLYRDSSLLSSAVDSATHLYERVRALLGDRRRVVFVWCFFGVAVVFFMLAVAVVRMGFLERGV